MALVSGGSRICRRGVLVHSCVRSVREIFEATPTLGAKPHPFSIVLETNYVPALPVQSICFRTSFLLKHSKVSHSSSFHNYYSQKRGFHLAYHQYFLVLDAIQRGVHLHLPYPPGSATACTVYSRIEASPE
jgi:hypothetical protein